MNSSALNSTDRTPVAAGRFYSATGGMLTEDLSDLFNNCKRLESKKKTRAIISPHAGYVYSGRIAASAFSSINRSAIYENIFLIGSSHTMAFEGASVYSSGDFISPMGKVKVNKELGNRLREQSKLFKFSETAHIREHSLEVQLPFLQYFFQNDPPIIPIIIGTGDTGIIKEISTVLKKWFTGENLFIISSDFSHYPPYDIANEVDAATSRAIISGDPGTFLKILNENSEKKYPGLLTSMCGWTSCLTLLCMSEGNEELEYRHIDYCNSGDSQHGSRKEVVGYHSIALLEK